LSQINPVFISVHAFWRNSYLTIKSAVLLLVFGYFGLFNR